MAQLEKDCQEAYIGKLWPQIKFLMIPFAPAQRYGRPDKACHKATEEGRHS